MSEYQTQNDLVLEMLQARGERGLCSLCIDYHREVTA